jgi:2-methylisocitrate lyase-like PEP mutase family enzyme
MTDAAGRAALAEAAAALRALHHADRPLVLANVWDPPSASAVARAGAAAIATTSSGVAAALGYPDGEVIPAADMFAAIRRISAAVSVPVTADLEGGYGLAATDLVDRLLAAGAVGLNLEDTDRSGAGSDGLISADDAGGRISDVREAAERTGVAIVINARIDVFLRSKHGSEGVSEALRRGRVYLDAGADSVYPIGLDDGEAIRRIVQELGAPVNILLRPSSPTLDELQALGVRRISVGGGLARHAEAHIERLARQLLAGDGSAFATLGET